MPTPFGPRWPQSWPGIEPAVANFFKQLPGCRFCYMGDSGGSASLAQHKKQFGAQPREYAQYRIERLPLTAAEQGVKRLAKWALRFKD